MVNKKQKKTNAKPKVFITRKIPGDAISRLQKKYQVKVYPKDEKIPRKELLKGIKWCDAILSLLTEKIDKQAIDANPNLKVISNYAVGFNNVDVKYATEKGIPVCNTPSQQVVDAVAEHTFTLILSLAKRIHEDEVHVRKRKWQGWKPKLLLGTQVKGKTLGIVGLGKIGSGVAERAAHGLGMQVIYYDVQRNKQFEKKYKAKFMSLNNLLKTSDFVTLHVPLLPKTKHLISSKQFSMMKKSAFLINTSRGPVVDEKALIKALKQKKIAGAGLDVYETEPKVESSLIKMNNVVLTPHTASATVEVRQQMGTDAADSIIAILSGKKSKKTVNPEVYKK